MDRSLAERARSALERHQWREAWELLSEADADGTLGPEELGLLGEAAWWMGRLPAAIDARERAYAAAIRAAQPELAAMAAIQLAQDNVARNSPPVATAWLNRAERLLSGLEESPMHGWLAAARAFRAVMTGDLDEGLEQSLRAREIGVRFGDRDLETMSLSSRGVLLLAKGEVEKALPLLDEATVAAVGGELRPAVAGGVCCATIEACSTLGDLRRAAEWTEAQDRWCAREGINGFPGMCRLFRAEIKRIRGSWLEAESEARHAGEELDGFVPIAVGGAMYTIGEIRLRRGDLAAAEEALLRAHAYGRDPEPALSLVRLAQGRTAQANAAIARALDEAAAPAGWSNAPPKSDLARAALLPARVQIALAAGDLEAARGAADELRSLADRFRAPMIGARAAVAAGEVAAAAGDPSAGARALREGVRLWSEIDAPYEVAAARLVLARAEAAAGNADGAILEARAAREAFERLGAALDLRRADEFLAALEPADLAPRAGGRRARVVRTFAFTDNVDSTRYAELLGDEAWDRLMRWHDETLRSVVAEHGGEEVKATGDGFFLAFDDVDRAIEGAIGIQRRLAEHREAHGFAPAVRIGLHRAEASRAGLDYAGRGVNLAARVAAAAGGGEILASASTLAAARRAVAERERRTAVLKGIEGSVELVSIDWR